MARKFVLLISHTSGKDDGIRENLSDNNISTIVSTSYMEGLDIMLTFHPSLVIWTCGTSVTEQKQIHELSEKLLQKLIPFIVVTTRLDRQSLKQLHRQGVFDTVELPLDFTDFNRLVMTRLAFKEHVDNELIYDELAGVFKRKVFYEHFEQKIVLTSEQPLSFTAALVNINKLKTLNTLIGINEVDKIIVHFVDLLKKSDGNLSIYRFSGKEFLVLFEEESMAIAMQRLNEIASQFIAYGKSLGLAEELTFSTGLAYWDSPDKTVNSLLHELDTDLGRSQVKRDDNLAQSSGDPSLSARPNLEIILLDDDPIILEILTNQLDGLSEETYHIKVKSFSNGHDFVHSEWYDPSTYYVLIVDGVMPKMSGFEVLQHVRSSYPSDKIIITMLTSRDSGADIDFALQTGADDYITKPFRPKEVSLRIQRLIRRLFQ